MRRAADSQTGVTSKHPHTYCTACWTELDTNGSGPMCKLYTQPVSLMLFTTKPQMLFIGMFYDSSEHLREAAFTTSHLTECCETQKTNKTQLLKRNASKFVEPEPTPRPQNAAKNNQRCFRTERFRGCG